MNWIDYQSYIGIYPPKEFNYDECLVFLNRSEEEILHQIKNDHILKVISIKSDLLLIDIGFSNGAIQVTFPIHKPTVHQRREVAAFVWEWFDLDTDLSDFYEIASKDKVLRKLSTDYFGLRIMCIPDLFEALAWAIIGQQINLRFAYTLKKYLVEHFGESLEYDGGTYWVFPSIEKINSLCVEDLQKLQYSTRKAEYIIGIAQLMTNGDLSKEKLFSMRDYHQIHKYLVSIRGIGPWTADYVMMKCLHYRSAFPITDVGLHNALKVQLAINRKPTINEINEIALNWEGWQAYATFYLWRSLYV